MSKSVHFLLLIALMLASPGARADVLEIEVLGVGEQQANNIISQMGGGWVSGSMLSSERRRSKFKNRAETEAVIALRPFGYYHATATGELTSAGKNAWKFVITVRPGSPVTVASLELEIVGEGANHASLVQWKDSWPLTEGETLVHPMWDERKETLMDLADEAGFLLAEFSEHRIELDLETRRADLFLVFDTGPRAVMGTITYNQDLVRESALTPVARFEPGDHYRGWLVEQLRTDLWRLAYSDDIEIIETRNLEADPPSVDLEVKMPPGNRNTHQGTLGYGTDTEFRMQYRWQRHLISDRGDSLSAGMGWQARNEELLLFAEYRLPRAVDSHQYWLVNPILKQENQEFSLDIEGRDESLPIGSGRVDDFYTRFGRAKLRNPTISREQIIETIFVDYLKESSEVSSINPGLNPGGVATDRLLPRGNVESLSVGIDWDWPVIVGRGFQTTGHRERAWLFTSNEAWGSDVDFSQAYLSSRRNILLGERWKLLLRGEFGYSDAQVEETTIAVDDVLLGVSITELPFEYRFKAGGSYSVRGYDFESLSNNGIGSNNIITASAEIEYLLNDSWSVAAFVDTGNAFNDWDKFSLRTGVGVGVRWYIISFPIRVDVARALDLEDEPWQLHITIGSPLF